MVYQHQMCRTIIADVDFPVFRLSEMYLIYAEAHLRGGGGDDATALNYLNKSGSGLTVKVMVPVTLVNLLPLT
jgi:hypothetical protein